MAVYQLPGGTESLDHGGRLRVPSAVPGIAGAPMPPRRPAFKAGARRGAGGGERPRSAPDARTAGGGRSRRRGGGAGWPAGHSAVRGGGRERGCLRLPRHSSPEPPRGHPRPPRCHGNARAERQAGTQRERLLSENTGS